MIINEFAESRTEEKNMEEKQIQIPDVNADAEELAYKVIEDLSSTILECK